MKNKKNIIALVVFAAIIFAISTAFAIWDPDNAVTVDPDDI